MNAGALRSQQGSCLSIYDGNNYSKPYGWKCNQADPRQQWRHEPVSHRDFVLRSAMGSCLSLCGRFSETCVVGGRPCSGEDQNQNWTFEAA